MSQQSDYNKSLTVKFFEQVFNNQNYGLVPALISRDYKFNGEPMTANQTVAKVKELQAKYPGLLLVIEVILGEDEKVALRWRINVTDPAKGTKGYLTGTNIIVFVSGQVLTNDQCGGEQFIPLSTGQPATP